MNWDTYHTKNLKSKYVYRFLSLEKLIDLLETSSIYLTRLDRFKDKLENISPFEIVELKAREGLTKIPDNRNPSITLEQWTHLIKKNKRALNDLQIRLIESQKQSFVSCWVMGKVESFAMWDIYGDEGFALRFDRKDFQNLVKNASLKQKDEAGKIEYLVAGKVIYQNFDEVAKNEKRSLMKFSVFRKHLSFKHENEYRIVGFSKNLTNTPGVHFQLPNIEELDFDIIANPRINGLKYDKYRKIISHFSKKNTLRESDLKIWLEFSRKEF